MGKFVANIISCEVATKNKEAKRLVANPANARKNARGGSEVEQNLLQQRGAFVYFDKGSMATIGRAKAVAEVAGMKFHGIIAWFAWLFIHLILLVGFHNRILVFLSWGFSYLTFSKGSRIISGNPQSHVVSPVGSETGHSATDHRKAVNQLIMRMQ